MSYFDGKYLNKKRETTKEEKVAMATIGDLEKRLDESLGLVVIFRAKPTTKLNIPVAVLNNTIKKSPVNTGLKTIAGRILEITNVPFVVVGAFTETVVKNPKLGDLHPTCIVYRDFNSLPEKK